MKFREYRGGFADSMATLVELPDRAALVKHVEKLYDYIENYDFRQLTVTPYFMERDERCGWEHTYIVSLPGIGPIGYTDEQPLTVNKNWLRRLLGLKPKLYAPWDQRSTARDREDFLREGRDILRLLDAERNAKRP